MNNPKTQRHAAVRESAVLVLATIAMEFIGRRFVARWLPTLGAPRVNDMLVLGIVYALLLWLTTPLPNRQLSSVFAALGRIAKAARHYEPWLVALLSPLIAIVFSLVDRLLWASVKLPLPAAAASPHVFFAGAADVLVPISMFIVNGVIVPIAEERVWRGLVQVKLASATGWTTAIPVTAVLFSFKHVLVDASPARLLAIAGGSAVLGVLARYKGWQASAVAHVVMNTVAMTFVFLNGSR